MDFTKDIDQCIAVLKNGKTMLYPTDTIWGLGCDATNEQAVQKIYSIKNRPPQKSFIVLCKDLSMAEQFIGEIDERLVNFAAKQHRAVTLIVKNTKFKLATSIHSTQQTIAFRIPDDDFCLQLIQAFGKPIVSSSANLSGAPSPGHFDEVSQELIQKVDYIVRFRQEEKGKNLASMVIGMQNDKVFIFRK